MLDILPILVLAALPIITTSLPTTIVNPTTNATNTTYSVFSSLYSAPPDWSVIGDPLPSTPVILSIFLRPGDEKLYNETLTNIMIPGNPEYGHFLSGQELADLTKPKNTTIGTIRSWLIASGVPPGGIIPRVDGSSPELSVHCTVATAEDLLRTKYRFYERQVIGEVSLRALVYSVPANVAPLIMDIQPTNGFDEMQLSGHSAEGGH